MKAIFFATLFMLAFGVVELLKCHVGIENAAGRTDEVVECLVLSNKCIKWESLAGGDFFKFNFF